MSQHNLSSMSSDTRHHGSPQAGEHSSHYHDAQITGQKWFGGDSAPSYASPSDGSRDDQDTLRHRDQFSSTGYYRTSSNNQITPRAQLKGPSNSPSLPNLANLMLERNGQSAYSPNSYAAPPTSHFAPPYSDWSGVPLDPNHAQSSRDSDSLSAKIEDNGELEDDDDGESGESSNANSMTLVERLAARRKMKRFRLTHQQTRFLVSEFGKQPHPDAAHRERLSREIPGLSPRQVQVWFQNRRAKIKRMNVDDRDRMLRMRAVPDGFDNVQALHSPYGAVYGVSGHRDYSPYGSSRPMHPLAPNDTDMSGARRYPPSTVPGYSYSGASVPPAFGNRPPEVVNTSPGGSSVPHHAMRVEDGMGRGGWNDFATQQLPYMGQQPLPAYQTPINLRDLPPDPNSHRMQYPHAVFPSPQGSSASALSPHEQSQQPSHHQQPQQHQHHHHQTVRGSPYDMSDSAATYTQHHHHNGSGGGNGASSSGLRDAVDSGGDSSSNDGGARYGGNHFGHNYATQSATAIWV